MKFIFADFSGIEARVTPWCAGQLETLEVFRKSDTGTGPDIYCSEAQGIYGRPIDKSMKAERQVGKCAVLGLGYQGGIGAFHKMTQIYGVSLAPVASIILTSATENELSNAEFAYNMYKATASKSGFDYFTDKKEGMTADIIKQRWRKANSKIVKHWGALESAAIQAVKHDIRKDHTSLLNLKTKFYMHHNATGYKWLVMELPSGRPIYYPMPEVKKIIQFEKEREILSYASQCSTSKQWVRTNTYGGALTENEVQAVARDIMVNAMFDVRKAGHTIQMTIHDELINLCENDVTIHEIEDIMKRPAPWALDLPIGVEGKEGTRYDK